LSLVIVIVMLGSDPEAELVRHFLIETTSKGVRLKGCNNEPTFGELSIFCYGVCSRNVHSFG